MATSLAAADSTPPPLHHVPTGKQKKYDRQLRLWAASGQQALEDAHVLLINSGPGVAGIEALKNLVLPGVGHYTILDSALVSDADLGVNFFLDDSCLGGFRAEHTCNLLQELNPDVEGHFITEPVQSFLSAEDALRPYTLVMAAAPIAADVLSSIATYTHRNHIPLFYLHSLGFYSHFSLSLPPAFPIVDTHPDPASITDLRLLNPWPALIDFAHEKTSSLDSLSEHERAHVPYLLLLLHCLEDWKAKNAGSLPTTYAEKSDFRDLVRSAAPSPDEENYAEASAAVLKSLNPPTPPSSVLETLSAPEAQNLSPTSPSFWFIANAIYRFYQTHAQLPLPGAVPDMKAQSADYIRLQNIYKQKARQDAAEVLATVRELEQTLGRSSPIDDKEVDAFCKGAAHVKLVRGRPLLFPRPSDPEHANQSRTLVWGKQGAQNAVNALMMVSALADTGILLYIAFLAWDMFVSSHQADALGAQPRIPGDDCPDTDVDADEEKLRGTAEKVLDDVIAEAGSFIENPEYENLKQELGKIVAEM